MTIRGAYPTGWQGGGVYTGDNYDELLKYQIRLHRQGEGVYSPDNDEAQFHNLDGNRRLIESVLGDLAIGDAFKIIGTSANNDFTIRGGDTTADGAFHFYLRGHDVIVETNTTYLTQNTDLNGALIAAPTALTTPSGVDRTDEIYLDIFLLHVSGVEDAPLIPDLEATSKTNRLRLISQVLVAEGGTTPSDFIDGQNIPHYTVKLATLERFDAQDAINVADITDDRLLILKEALGGDKTGAGVPAFNPSAMKVVAQDTPDNTVKVPLNGVIISSDGLRVIDFKAQSTGVFAPAATSTETRFYLVQVDDAGALDIGIFSQVLTTGSDFIVDHPDLEANKQGLAIVRVVGDGVVTITQDDIFDIRHWLNKGGGGGAGAIVAAPIDRFTVLFGAPQSVFPLTFSAGDEDDLIAVRNGVILFAEGNTGSDDYFLSTPTQVTITNPTIPGTLLTETLMFIPRAAVVDNLVVIGGSNIDQLGDGTQGPYPVGISDTIAPQALVFVAGALQNKTSYTLLGGQLNFLPVVGVTPSVTQTITVAVPSQITTIGASLESLGVVVAGAGPTLKSPDGTNWTLTVNNAGELVITEVI